MFKSIEKHPFLAGFLFGLFVSKKLRRTISKFLPKNITIVQFTLENEEPKEEREEDNNNKS